MKYPFIDTIGNDTTLNHYRRRLKELWALLNVNPVDTNTTHSSVPVSDGSTFPVVTANTLKPMSSVLKTKVEAKIQELAELIEEAIIENQN